MKLFGYIKVNTEGFGDGTEADVTIKTDLEEAVKTAFEDYVRTIEQEKAWCTLDTSCEVYDTLEEFKNELLNGYVLLQYADFHVQYEYFEREVE